jgi:hypothetical protein
MSDKTKKIYRITGNVLNAKTHEGLAGLRVEAWDKDLIFNDLVGSAVTDTAGMFVIHFDESYFAELFLDRKPDLFFKVYQDETLIKSTEDSVLWNVENRSTPILIEVDIETPEKPEPETKPMKVQGQISSADGLHVENIVVRAFDKDLRSEELLGETRTSKDGRYAITYSPEQFRRAEKAGADLFIRVLDEQGNILAASPVHFNAGPEETIDLMLDASQYAGLSEYERLLAQITHLLENIPLVELTQEDIEFLTGETGANQQYLQWLVSAAQRENDFEGPQRISAPAFYGWLRQGMPVEKSELLKQSIAGLIDALKKAIGENIVPASLADQFDHIESVFSSAKAASILETAPPHEAASLGNLLGLLENDQALTPEQADQFALINAEAVHPAEVWQKASEILNPVQITGLQSVIALNQIAEGSQAVITRAKSYLSESSKTNIESPLVKIASLEKEDWSHILEAAGTVGESELASSAREHMRRVAALMPNDFLMVRATVQPEAGQLLARIGHLAELEKSNGTQMFNQPLADLHWEAIPEASREATRSAFADIQRTVNYFPGLKLGELLSDKGEPSTKVGEMQRRIGLVDRLYRQNPEVDFLALDYLPESNDLNALNLTSLEGEDQKMALRTVKAYQRVQHITGDALLSKELLEAGFHSSNAIADLNLDEFSRRAGLDPYEAFPIHQAASDRAVNTGLAYISLLDSIQNLNTSDPDLISPASSINRDPAVFNYLRRLDGFDEIFGRQATCHCQDCQSVLSPAAYFVDLMHFIEINVRTSYIPLTHPLHLHTRRPDLWDLELTCENTKKIIPYLEIINEILENAVAQNLRPQPPAPVQRAVYQRLAQTQESFQQPLVLPLRRIETYLKHFDRSRASIAAALGVNSETYARARLGLSIAEERLITQDRSADQRFLRQLFRGIALPDVDVALLLTVTHWTREDLGQLLATRFISRGRAIRFQAERSSPESLQNDREVVRGLDNASLDRLHRFTRLWRKLPSWSIAELDQVLFHLQASGVQEVGTQLQKIAILLDIQARFSISTPELCTLFAPFPAETFGDKPTLFDRLFNRVPFVTRDGEWSADGRSNGAFRNAPESSNADRLMAGLQVDADTLDRLMNGLRLGPNFDLTVANLALLYRHALLCRLLKIPTDKLFQLIDIVFHGNPEPRRVSGLNDLQTLLDTYDQIIMSGFILDDISFLLGNPVLNSTAYPNVSSICANIIAAIQSERAFEFDDTVLTQQKQTSGEPITEQQSKDFISTNPNVFERITNSQKWWLKKEFDPESSELNLEVFTLPANPPNPSRLIVDLEEIRDLLNHFHPRSFLPNYLAGQLHIPREKIEKLAQIFGANRLLQHDLTLIDELRGGRTPRLSALVEKLPHLSVLFRDPIWDEAALQLVADKPALLSLDANHPTLSLQTILNVASYKQLAAVKDDGSPSQQRRPNVAQLRSILGNQIDNQHTPVAGLATALGLSLRLIEGIWPFLRASTATFKVLKQLVQAVEVASYLGVSGETLGKMAAPGLNREYTDLADAADGLFAAIRAKYPEEAVFAQKIEGFEDAIRGFKRDGLVEYLIRSSNRDFASPNDLYAYFLVDTQLEGCARTSRIVAANASLQLYVHRILMNLERSSEDDPNPIYIPPSAIPAEWEWRKHYRTWEANRKIFLYPENYLEPELRDDKTPLFEELESNLLQQKISETNVTDAFATYLTGYEEVANLEIVGAFDDANPETYTDILHLIGATNDDPPLHYYRTVTNLYSRESGAGPNPRVTYSPWRKIQVQIPVKSVSPVVFKNKLYLFWVEISTMRQNQLQGGESRFTGYKHRFTVKMCYCKPDGSWAVPQKLRVTGYYTSNRPLEAVDDPVVEQHPPLVHSVLWRAPRWSGANGNQIEPIDEYTVHGFEWERVYPAVHKSIETDEVTLLITGMHACFNGFLDPYNRNIPYLGLSATQPRSFLSRALHITQTQLAVYTFRQPREAGNHLFLGSNYLFKGSGEITNEAELYPAPENLAQRSWNQLGQIQGSRELLMVNRTVEVGSDPLYIQTIVTDAIVDFGPVGAALILGSPMAGLMYKYIPLGTSIRSQFNSQLFTEGLDGLLSLAFQTSLAEASLPVTPSNFSLIRLELPPNPTRLDYDGPYGIYLREVFFHIPFIIANHLNSQQKFAAAQRWYHYLFDPTSPIEGEDDPAKRVWHYREFHEQNMVNLRRALTNESALEEYRKKPFNPFAIARLRPGAFQKAIVMKYIDNLLDWGDNLFAQFTMESVGEATMLYVMASDILGPRPVEVGDCQEPDSQPMTYRRIAPYLDNSSDFIIELEHLELVDTGMLKGQKNISQLLRYEPVTELAKSAVGPAVPAASNPKTAQASGSISDPLNWRKTGQSLWAKVGGTDLRTLAAFGDGLGNGDSSVATPGLESQNNRYRISVSPDPIVPHGPNATLPAGALGLYDYQRSRMIGSRDTFPSAKYQPKHVLEICKTSLVFCVPPNKDLRDYWDRVERRLYNIHNCMDINGVRRDLALFSAELDPRLLARARAEGLSLQDVLDITNGSLPPYRFTFLIEKAKQYTATVQSFGALLLAALEKKDVEELNRLRAVHEQNLLTMRRRIQEWEVEAANDALAGLRQQQSMIEYRRDYYDGLVQIGLNPWERTQQVTRSVLSGNQTLEATMDVLAGVFALIPQAGAPTAMKYGGVELSGSMRKFASAMDALTRVSEAISASAGLEATFQRRSDDWKHQKQLAEKELLNIDKQIAAAQLRVEIAQRSLDVHNKTMEQAQELFEFYRDKFSSFGLYTWLSSQLYRLYREAFNVAFAAAKMAEQAYHFERPDDPTLLAASYWDTSNSGLLVGERLLLDLQALDRRFIETNYRTLEIEQSFSLLQFAPEQLVRLRETGECEFAIPELFFNLAYPGHYQRRIKAVRLTIPCVAGPYTNVGATLRLKNNSLRREPNLNSPLSDLPLRHTTTIATSTAQNDAGVFEFNFRDERYMPFEGAGAISAWELTLPKNFHPFDYRTISDVILRISYTALESEILRGQDEHLNNAIEQAIYGTLEARNGGLERLFSLRHDLPTAFYQLLNPQAGAPQQTRFELTTQHFPYFLAGKSLNMSNVSVYLVPKGGNPIATDGLSMQINRVAPVPEGLWELVQWELVNSRELINSKLKKANFSIPGSPIREWIINTGLNGLVPNDVEDILLLIKYQTTAR